MSRRPRFALLSAGLLAVLGIAVLLVHGSGGTGSSRPPVSKRTVLIARPGRPLPAPISGESVAGLRGSLLIIGGLDSSEVSVGGIFSLDATSEELAPAGELQTPAHDAAAAVLGEEVLVFGGGAEASSDEVQVVSLIAGGPPKAGTASVIGHLPTVRSDLSAVNIGGRVFILGGYDGEAPLSPVLESSDGRSFSEVVALPAPARYMAVATSGGVLYAFGGQLASGSATDAIREVDPEGATARVVGHLPQALSHASAVTLGGRIFLLGGETDTAISDQIWSFDPKSKAIAPAGRLPQPVADGAAASVGSTGYLIGGKGSDGSPLPSVVRLETQVVTASRPVKKEAPPSSWQNAGNDRRKVPFDGELLIADRGNNRLLVVNAEKEVLWRFPSHAQPAPPGGFYFPDDAFFTHGGTQIIANEEQNERIVQLTYPMGKVVWSYGHPHVTGSDPGYLHEPDDAYLLPDGTVTVADAQNCRVLLISPQKKIKKTFGEPERCEHEPPTALGSPNGDTPLANGNILISEVNGSYIDEITPTGKLVWSTQLPIEYPSDPQQLGPNLYLVADYTDPGGIYEFNRAGKILWAYHPSSGQRMLNHPSLAERLPNGLICTNDDYRHRVVIIDPKTRKIVWQYGHTGEPGLGHGRLRIPDGFDLLEPDGTTPTHPYTG